jgi:ferrous iron transport protein B
MSTVASRPLIALVGNPNCGKTALFNLLTGSRQKVANYAGVTVERKEGRLVNSHGRSVHVLDLPGTYSLHARTPDEQVTCDYVLGRLPDEPRAHLLVVVVDATNLKRQLRLVMQLKRTGHRLVIALNMVDLARRHGLIVDSQNLSAALGIPVIETVGIKGDGAASLIEYIHQALDTADVTLEARTPSQAPIVPADVHSQMVDQQAVDAILQSLGYQRDGTTTGSERIDRVVLHPVVGPLLLLVILFVIFQAVFAWAQPFMSAISGAIAWLAAQLMSGLAPGLLRSLLVDGVLAGAGAVLVFLPQIVLLFAFILLLEDSGYLPRAAFLLDRLMGGVGLSGRSFIPLLSSFACAIPGVMATRTIPNPRDRLVTILIAPLMTCSARLPVYALLIGAFIPSRTLSFGVQLQGVVLFFLYLLGVLSAFLVALLLKGFRRGSGIKPLQMELPSYHWPSARHLLLGLFQRIEIFLKRVGSIIVSLMVLLWFFSSVPTPPVDFVGPAIQWSYAGRAGAWLLPLFAPIGFNWQIVVALIPGLAAREVAIGALGTVYALGATGSDVAGQLAPLIQSAWSVPTALALLAWYVFAPQCVSTLAVVRRETNSWWVPAIMAGYQFAMAYGAAWLTFHISRAVLGGT